MIGAGLEKSKNEKKGLQGWQWQADGANGNEMQDFYYFDHAYLFGNKHDKSKEIGEKIYRLTKNWFQIFIRAHFVFLR